MKEEVSVLAESRESSKTLPGKTGKKKLRAWYKNWQLYLLALPALAIIAVFCYAPMYGIIIAFKDYNVIQGIGGSPWADPIFKHFTEFVTDPYFLDMLWNTLRLSLCSLLVFPLPILFALLLNEIRVKSLRTTVQSSRTRRTLFRWSFPSACALLFWSIRRTASASSTA